MDGIKFGPHPVPFFSVQVKNGVTTLTNRAPDQPSFLSVNDDTEGNVKSEVPQAPDCRSCNCRNSKCLKLYCECFAASLYCVGCNCNNCMNTPEYDKERSQAVHNIQQRNPDAFKTRQAGSKRESTSCRCKKSGCSKKYCECFQNGLSCSDACQCTDCQNPFDLSSKKALSPNERLRPQFDPSAIEPSIVKLARDMITAAQRLSDQEAAHDLLTLSFLSPDATSTKRQRLSDEASGAKSMKDPPSPKTARLLCDEAPDMPGMASEGGRSDLYKQQEIEILTRLDDYLKDVIIDSYSKDPMS